MTQYQHTLQAVNAEHVEERSHAPEKCLFAACDGQVSSTKSIAAQQAARVNMIGTSPVLIDPTQETAVVDKATQSQRQTRENYVAKAINFNQPYLQWTDYQASTSGGGGVTSGFTRSAEQKRTSGLEIDGAGINRN